MSVEGYEAAGRVLRGKVSAIGVIYTDAYQIAVQNGFEGTETEWLETIKGEPGKDGKDGAAGPKGEKGDTGSQGPRGESGDSCTVDVNEVAEGVELVVTNTASDGAISRSVSLVKHGANGQDGKTPVRGTDYWTDADKAEIKAYVDEAILGGAW